MEHRFLRLFDKDGNWKGNPDRTIKINGVVHDMDEYAKAHGIKLPDVKKNKKHINIDIEENHEDMGQSFSSADTEEHGDGDSEG